MSRPGAFGDLGARAAAGLVMAAAAIWAVWSGGWGLAALAAAVAGLMAWELRRMSAPRFDLAGWIAAAGGAGACLLTEALMLRWGVLWAVLCLAAAAALVRRESGLARLALIVGGLYVAVAAAGLVGLRADPLYGVDALIWVGVVVVAADTGGYFAGRLVGGPKLWPAVSPGKTWSGLLGGVALAGVAGAVFSAATVGTLVHEVALVSAVMAVVSQGGDLAESALKRRCGVKDSSRLIPGHGGLLDRMDGLLAAGLVAALITFLRGKSIFIW